MREKSLTLAGLYQTIESRADADFLVTSKGALPYSGFAKYLRRACGLFDRQQLSEGARVLIVTQDETAAIVLFVAALLDGKVPIMLAPHTTEARAAGICAAISPGMIVVDASRQSESWTEDAKIVRALPKTLFGRVFADVPSLDIEAPDKGRAPHLPASPDALAYILFTSGTTQAPNGVMVSQRNLLSHLSTLSRLFGYDHQSRIFNSMMLAHGDGLVQGPLLALANGCALIRTGVFSIAGMENWLNSVRANRTTHFFTVPAIYSLVDRYAAHHDYFDAPECAHLMSVAARLDTGLWQRLEARFRRPVFNHYGLTETVASALYAGAHPEMGPIGTVGKPIDMQARLMRPDDVVAADGEAGELQLSGDNVFVGYWNNPQRTAETRTADGWLRTGDMARRHPDGAYEFLGRLKTVIMYGGLLIRPEEIDEVLSVHPAVVEVASFGFPDADFEEVPASVVVLDSPASEAELAAFCRSRLEPLKVPKWIVPVQAIPRGDAGKPRLAELRDVLSSRLAGDAVGADNERRAALAREVIALAAQIFRVAPAMLDGASSSQTVPGWDSFSQIHLVLSAESRFSVVIPVAEIAAIRTLNDLVKAIELSR